jgi:hypothetical protein
MLSKWTSSNIEQNDKQQCHIRGLTIVQNMKTSNINKEENNQTTLSK